MGVIENIFNSIIVDPVKSSAAILLGIYLLYLIYNDKFAKRSEQSGGRQANVTKQRESQTKSESLRYTDEVEDDEDIDEGRLVAPQIPENNAKIPFVHRERLTADESLRRSCDFYTHMNNRRSVRSIRAQEVPIEIINNLIKTAGTAPSGAHTEPWTYVAIKNPDIKAQLREIVEREEYINYEKRMGDQWVKDISFINTNEVKEYITEAPWIILVFRQAFYPLENGKRRVHYYNEISTSISVGLLLVAIHNAGLVSVTTTPLNCGPGIRKLLNRPIHEKLMFLLPVGYPMDDAMIPDIKRKNIDEIMLVM